MGFGMLLRNAIALMYTAAYGGFMYAVEIVEGLCMRVLWVRALGVRGLLELLHVILSAMWGARVQAPNNHTYTCPKPVLQLLLPNSQVLSNN